MTADALPNGPLRSLTWLTADELGASVTEAVLGGAIACEAEVATVSVSGSGAVMCLQGVLTNDIEAPGPDAFVYGALLTPKGMIVTDLWLARGESDVHLSVPTAGRDPLLDVFRRSLPPRLARVEDQSADLATLRIIGPAAIERLRGMGFAVPAPGRAAESTLDKMTYRCARSPQDAPFVLQLTVQRDRIDDCWALLAAGGVMSGTAATLGLARVLAGWPSLGSEIGNKTLPQEVRFDEIDGVSYSKGCFTGQETVARVHFRGHVNRQLVGLLWEDQPGGNDSTILREDKAVGHVTTVAWFAPLETWIGLGVVRREVDPGAHVAALGGSATIHDLPFDLS